MTTSQTAGIIIGVILYLLIVPRIVAKRFRRPAPAFIGPFLDSQFRYSMQPPDKVIRRSGIQPGMTVLDLGCGNGAFTVPVARAVGERGKVIAVDMQRAMLWQLERKLAKARNRDIKNVEVKRASAYELPLGDGTVDLVLMVASLPEMAERERALREVKRVLKPGGILAVSEMIVDTDFPWRSTTIELCEGQGFVVDESAGAWWSYTVRFRKPAKEV